jgi:hypothetical protein
LTGWTPDVIDNQPAELLDRIIAVSNIRKFAAEERAAARTMMNGGM